MACTNRDQQKSNPDFETWLNNPESRKMYNYLIETRDTLSTTEHGEVIYNAYEMFRETLGYPCTSVFHCYEYGDTALTCFDIDLSPSDFEGRMSFVFINTPSKFTIISTKGALPDNLKNGCDFDGLMKYIAEQKNKQPIGNFKSQIIQSSQEFSGWQYEFDKRIGENDMDVYLTDSNGFYCKLTLPDYVKTADLPPFFFAKLKDFSKICLPSLYSWCWE